MQQNNNLYQFVSRETFLYPERGDDMKQFHYRAYDEEGQLIDGTLWTESRQEARRELYDRGLHLIRLVEEPTRRSLFHGKKPFRSRRQLILLCSSWASLLEAGLTVTDSLSLLQNQLGNLEKKCLQQITQQIATGHTVWESFMKSQSFPPFFISLLQVGEMTGTLPRELLRGAAYYEKEDAFLQKIKRTLVYPLFVLAFSLAVLVVILTFILPSFQLLFETLQIDLPLGAQWALAVGVFLKQWGAVLSVFFLCVLLLGLVWGQTKSGKDILSSWLYGFRFYRRLLLIRFCLTLSALLESGKTLAEALADTKQVVGNQKAGDDISYMKEQVQKGAPFSTVLQESGFSSSFPLLYQLCQVGMESGELPKFLSQAAYMMADEAEQKLNRFRAILEPTLLLFVGGITALIIFSVMLPVFQAAGRHLV